MNWKGQFLQAFTFVVLPCLGATASWFALRWSALTKPYVMKNYSVHVLPFVLLLAAASRSGTWSGALSVAYALLGFLVAVNSDTADPVYRFHATPAFLAAHLLLIPLLAAEIAPKEPLPCP